MVSLVQDGDLVGCGQKPRMLRVAPRRPVVGEFSSSKVEQPSANQRVTGSNPVDSVFYELKQKCATLGR